MGTPGGQGLAGGLGGSLLGGILTSIFGGDPAASPQGKAKLTTVVLATYENGVVEVRSMRDGTPYLMSRDMQVARRVARAVRKADARLPKKTVQPSKAKQLSDALTDKAMRDAMSDDCAPTCCK